ncbi:MAG: protein TolQ [Bdellovibrionales bacterium]|nr:protein TolQ [Bdellovibrionales bacterium]
MKNLIIIAFTLFCFISATPVEANPKESTPEEVAKIQVKSSTQIGVIEALRSASLVVQLTMILLVLMSIVSWSVILSKWYLFKNNKIHNIPLEDIFFKASSMDEIFDLSKSYPKSSLVTIFRAGYSELKKIISSKSTSQSNNLLSGMDNLQRALNKAVSNQISYMERRLPFLATTGSVSPFIGLFGTVFGIMHSFQKIGIMGSANLAVVAPGISEALIATGFGLFVAIPAAVFYNHFINELKKAELEFNNFVTDFLNISKRNFFK